MTRSSIQRTENRSGVRTNEAYEVVPKMEGNAAYGVTCHQSREVSSH